MVDAISQFRTGGYNPDLENHRFGIVEGGGVAVAPLGFLGRRCYSRASGQMNSDARQAFAQALEKSYGPEVARRAIELAAKETSWLRREQPGAADAFRTATNPLTTARVRRVLDAAERIAAERARHNERLVDAFVTGGGRMERCLQEVARLSRGTDPQAQFAALRGAMQDYLRQENEAHRTITPAQLESHAMDRARALLGAPPHDGEAGRAGLFAGVGLRPTHPWISQALSAPRHNDETLDGELEPLRHGASNPICRATYEIDGRAVEAFVKPILAGRRVPLVAGQIGIDQRDPGLEKRNKATMLVAQSLGWGDRVVDVDLGVHRVEDPKTGRKTDAPCLIMEKAPGKSAEEIMGDLAALDPEEQRAELAKLREDPVLQRSLIQLQIIDAITGQADRHGGNYIIDRDRETGAVRGVKGIDNDICFGSKVTDPEQLVPRRPRRDGDPDMLFDARARRDAKAFAWGVSLPPVIDRAMRDAVDGLDPAALRASLEGLLTEAEIDATMARLDLVKAHVWNASLVSAWGPGIPEVLGDPDASGQPRRESDTLRSSYLARDLSPGYLRFVENRLPQ
jgi:hypothetical protein